MKIRPPHRLKVANFGPIKSGEVDFGNLTVLVGPQATGKSILLQLLKLLVDLKHVKYEFKRSGIDWQDHYESFLDVYFGEGMRSLHSSNTKVEFEGVEQNLKSNVANVKSAKGESMFFIPAQRVLTLRDGWPQAFTYYDPGVPFTVREFSEELRLMMTDLAPTETLFPVPRRLKQEFRDLLQRHVFPGFNLKIDPSRTQKRLVLTDDETGSALPYMVWSAGQREFVPLLLGLYHLLTPAGASRRQGVKWVVIEELEMGLHPRAISIVMLMIFELVSRGYRVCISTHSPQVLDAVWALQHLRKNKAEPSVLLNVFDASASQGMLDLAHRVMRKRAKVYYFDREAGTIRDISDLDPEKGKRREWLGWFVRIQRTREPSGGERCCQRWPEGAEMSFRNAVEQTKHLTMAWQSGLQALRAEDKRHIDPQDTRKLRGSADIDSAWQQVDPDGNRWDFGIAYQHTNRAEEFIYWVELHTASDSQVKKVIAKTNWLLNWLKNGGKLLAKFEREIIWVSSGKTSFTLTAPQKKQMALAGLTHCGSKLRILDQRNN